MSGFFVGDQVNTEKGFEENDIFCLKPYAERLTKFMSHIEKGVIILDGQWGAGKTTFIKQWIASLNEKKDNGIEKKLIPYILMLLLWTMQMMFLPR